MSELPEGADHPVTSLVSREGIGALEDRGIKVRWSAVHPEKFTANYDQIRADEGDPIAQECRGLVLAQLSGDRGGPGEYTVVAQPFRRFFNLGQGAAAELDWESVRFEEKLDGTLMIVYWYRDQWNVATRGTPDADVPCADGQTFAEKFWKCINQDNHFEEYKLLDSNKEAGCTWLWEFTAPDNQIVLPYNETQLTLLGIICGKEFPVDEMTELKVRRPICYQFNTVEECWSWVHSQPGSKLEGLIAVDRHNRRVKLKNSQYLALSKVMTSAGSDAGLVEMILAGTVDDAIPHLPVIRRDRVEELRQGVLRWMREVDQLAGSFKGQADRKAVALAVQAGPRKVWLGSIMDIWSGQAQDTQDWLQQRRSKTSNRELPPSLVERITSEVTRQLDIAGEKEIL